MYLSEINFIKNVRLRLQKRLALFRHAFYPDEPQHNSEALANQVPEQHPNIGGAAVVESRPSVDPLADARRETRVLRDPARDAREAGRGEDGDYPGRALHGDRPRRLSPINRLNQSSSKIRMHHRNTKDQQSHLIMNPY